MEKFETESELISACLKHIPQAQRALYDKYVQAMYNTVYRYVYNHQDSQDILQNGFTRVFRHLQSFDPKKGDLLVWIRKIHIRCALDFIKKEQILFEDIDEIATMTNIYPLVDQHMDAEYILQLIGDLNPRDRVIFNMYHIEGYNHEEIAQLLSINVNSSRVYLARARKILRERITAYQGRISIVK
jgi:RNA polymerase sigma-70 factor (ECF subfamily)